MHHRELIHLAAVLAVHSDELVCSPAPWSYKHLQQYWTASRCRQDRWTRLLKRFSLSAPSVRRIQPVRPVLEEVFSAEVLVRVWAGIAQARSDLPGGGDAVSVLRNTMLTQHDARHHALKLLAPGQGLPLKDGELLNQLRCRAERWTDLLLSPLNGRIEVSDLAFDQARVIDFAGKGSHPCDFPEGEEQSRPAFPANSLDRYTVLDALRAAFEVGLSAKSANADLNAMIAESILACVPADLSTSTELFDSLWLMRLTRTADQTQEMIDQYLQLDT